MAPPSHIDMDALSGIMGSISIACWVVVFTPQIVENVRRGSADGLSLIFVITWLSGDVFNVLGGVLQHVLPTMLVLAVYYTLADIILLAQTLWYRRRRTGTAKTARTGVKQDDEEEAVVETDTRDQRATETSPLLAQGHRSSGTSTSRPGIADADRPARPSFSSSIRSSSPAGGVDPVHLSPATPAIPPPREPTTTTANAGTLKRGSLLSAVIFNTSALLLVSGIGALGWWLSARATLFGSSSSSSAPSLLTSLPIRFTLAQTSRTANTFTSSSSSSPSQSKPHFNPWGQTFGYLSAALYLGSRIPQLLLNFRRKSTEGVALLFFLFACVGNLTYVLSIFAYEPACARRTADVDVDLVRATAATSGCMPGQWSDAYGRYILVNTSWLLGSGGTLLLDFGIFAQFWMYRGRSTGEAR